MVSSESTFPLSHKSPLPAASSFSEPATRISQAVCRWPRSELLSVQKRRGEATSTPSGFTAYSQRRSVGISEARASETNKTERKNKADGTNLFFIVKAVPEMRVEGRPRF